MRELVLERGPALRRLVLHALVIGVPVFFLRVTLDPINVPKLALLAAGCAIVAGIRIVEITQGASARRLARLWIPAGLIATPLLFSWLLSPYRDWATFGLQPRFEGLVPYLIVISFGVLLADAFEGRAEDLGMSVCWAGAIVGAYAVIQTIGMDPFRWTLLGAETRAASTTGNPNFTGGFLAIVLPVGFALALGDVKRRRIVIRLLIPVALGWVVSRSQGAWAAGLAAIALVTGYHLRQRHRLAAIAGIFIAVLLTIATVGAVVIAMIRPTSRLTIGTAAVRAAWWHSAFDMGLAHPLAGRGPNSFSLEGVSHRPVADALRFSFDFPDDPHSVPLVMFANLGVPGLLGFIAVFGFALWRFTRFRAPPLLAVGFVAAVVAYFIQGTVSIDELTLRVGLWVGLAGLLAVDPEDVGAGRRENEPRKIKRGTKKRKPRGRSPLRFPVLVAVVGVLTVAGLVWPVRLVAADASARAAEDAFAEGDPTTGRERYEAASGLRGTYVYEAGLAFEFRDLAIAEDSAREEFYLQAVSSFRSFLDDAPFVFSLVSYGRLLDEWSFAQEGTGDPAAVDVLRRARAIDPRNPAIRADLATALIHLDLHQDAFDELAGWADVVPTSAFPDYWAALAFAAATVGEEEVARMALANAETLAATSDFTTRARRILDRGA